eukprot:13431629-Alexandrium_andersonii.AAC.1
MEPPRKLQNSPLRRKIRNRRAQRRRAHSSGASGIKLWLLMGQCSSSSEGLGQLCMLGSSLDARRD